MSTSHSRRYTARSASTVLLAGFLALIASAALADGMFIAAPERQIYERSQIAIIRHADGQEELQILPEFNGNAKDFAWIVPVPGLPTVDATDPEVFFQAATMTQILYKHRDAKWGCGQQDFAVYGVNEVQIISDEVVGIYRVQVIAADDAVSLVDVLTDWGFLRTANTAYVTPVLESYVDKGWYFVTMKVDQADLEEELPYLSEYWYGLMQPVRLNFASEEMVYPLHISSLSSYTNASVILYTIADHRMTYPGADTWYANRISASEMAAINRTYPAIGAELTTGDFVTKLVRPHNSPDFMDKDLVLTRADSDEEVRLINYSGFPLFNLLLGGSMLGWVALRLTRRHRRSANSSVWPNQNL